MRKDILRFGQKETNQIGGNDMINGIFEFEETEQINFYKKSCLKWAGGKYKLLDKILKYDTSKSFVDVFSGSAVVSINSNADSVVINDMNKDLIDLYSFIKTKKTKFLNVVEDIFLSNNNEADYYKIRDEFNSENTSIQKSAKFLYLNKYGYNGLCRYNKSGVFNVPFGKRKDVTLPKEEIENMHNIFKSKEIIFSNVSFEKCFDIYNSFDVFYCDPPYLPEIKDKKVFTEYKSGGFDIEQQKKLALLAENMMSKGKCVLISNHDCEISRELYKNSTSITSFMVNRNISSNGAERNKATELLAVYDGR
jgi:DNA adenine methylase